MSRGNHDFNLKKKKFTMQTATSPSNTTSKPSDDLEAVLTDPLLKKQKSRSVIENENEKYCQSSLLRTESTTYSINN